MSNHNSTNINKISIVIPVHNESESLKILHQQIQAVLAGMTQRSEIIYVDDGSTDDTYKILEELNRHSLNTVAIRLRRNFGKSAALAAGFAEATGEAVITMDGDLQDDPEEIPRLLEKLNEGYDLVSGWKQNRKDPLIKILSSRIFNLSVALLNGIKLHDFNCGFKIYRAQVIKNIEVYGELHRFLPVLAHQKGFRVGELAVKHNKRRFGSSYYGRFGLRRINNYLLDIINVFLITKYIKKPLHFFGTFGLLLFSLGFIVGLYISVLRLLTGSIQHRIPLLMLGILAMVIGIQLISLGFLGEIITSQNQKKEDVYNVREKLDNRGNNPK